MRFFCIHVHIPVQETVPGLAGRIKPTLPIQQFSYLYLRSWLGKGIWEK